MSKRIKTLVLAFVLIFVMLGNDVVFSTQTKEDLEKQKTQAQQELDELSKEHNDIKKELGVSNAKYQDVSDKLSECQSKLDEINDDIETTKENISAKQEEVEAQREAMSDRIVSFYENSNRITILLPPFSVDQIVTWLKDREYYNQLYSYDRKCLDEYKSGVVELQKQKEFLEKELVELEETQKQFEEDKNELLALISSQNKQLNDIESSEAEKQNVINQYKNQIDKMLELEKKYEEQKKKEEEQKKKEEEKKRKEEEKKRKEEEQKKKEEQKPAEEKPVDKTPTNTKVGEEELLAAIIYCEAGGASYEMQLAVGSVVCNRVKSSSFPNSITGVIYQKSQFSPVSSGRFAFVLENNLATGSCKKAAKEVLGGNITGSWLFFRVNDGSREGTIIQNVVFY